MSKETGGPAFPGEQGETLEGTWNQTWCSGMTLQAYAAIELRIPDSGLSWLDKMIAKAERRDIAVKAVQGLCVLAATGEVDDYWPENVAGDAYRYADALIAKGAEGLS